MEPTESLNQKQTLFNDIFIGTFIYAAILGFFNDYTSAFYASSYSIIFMAAFVMQLLTYPTFRLKGWIVRWFGQRDGLLYKIGLVISVWLVMFLSKFVFLMAIDFVFGQSVEIRGLVSLVVIIMAATIVIKCYELLYKKLGA